MVFAARAEFVLCFAPRTARPGLLFGSAHGATAGAVWWWKNIFSAWSDRIIGSAPARPAKKSPRSAQKKSQKIYFFLTEKYFAGLFRESFYFSLDCSVQSGDLFDLVKGYGLGLWGVVAVGAVYKGPDYIRAVGDVLNRGRQLDHEHFENMEKLKMNRRQKRREKEDA